MALRSALVVALLVVATVSLGVAPATTAADAYTIDADHGLTEQAAIDQYRSDGYAATNLTALDLRLEIASTDERLGVDEVAADANYHFLRIDYDEEITRELRIYIPADYWEPFPRNDLEALGDSTLTADMKPVENGSYTAITVTVDGPTEAVFAINRAQGTTLTTWQKTKKWAGNLTGFEVPSLLGNSEPAWQYIQASDLNSSDQAIRYNDSKPTLQYDALDDPAKESWLTVPKCDGEAEEVCYYRKDGVNNTVFVSSRDATPPQVRYREGGGGGAGAIVNGIGATVDRILEDVGSSIPFLQTGVRL